MSRSRSKEILVVVPDFLARAPRKEQALFARNRRWMLAQYPWCWVCSPGGPPATDAKPAADEGDLEAHHVIPYALWDSTDEARREALLAAHDYYGLHRRGEFDRAHGPHRRDNLVVVRAGHHRLFGLHNVSYAEMIAIMATRQ